MVIVLKRAMLVMGVAVSCSAVAQRSTPVSQAEVDAITRDAILIDTHDDVPSLTVDGYDIAKPNTKGMTDLPRMRGYLGAEFFAVFVDAEYVKGNHSANRTLQMIDTVRTDVIANHPNDFLFATTADEIERAAEIIARVWRRVRAAEPLIAAISARADGIAEASR